MPGTTPRTPLERLGFSLQGGGAHTARTMMLSELDALLACAGPADADKSCYLRAITEDNCLGKRSGKTRLLTWRHLVTLYGLDNSLLLFRTLCFFWHRDLPGRPLLALLCAYARDPLFRSSAPFILAFPEGAIVTREALETFIDAQAHGRFSRATLTSVAQNINATWTKSGHLRGRSQKIRARAIPTAGSVSYALLLGYLTGARGQGLFQAEYGKLLDCTFDLALELAETASRKDWITLKSVGDVIEVLFPHLITPQEREWLREQN